MHARTIHLPAHALLSHTPSPTHTTHLHTHTHTLNQADLTPHQVRYSLASVLPQQQPTTFPIILRKPSQNIFFPSEQKLRNASLHIRNKPYQLCLYITNKTKMITSSQNKSKSIILKYNRSNCIILRNQKP